jgi:hypothetical protein
MRLTVLIAALVAFASAAPYPQDQEDPSEDVPDDPEPISVPFATPTIPVTLTTSLNIPVTSSEELPTPVPDTDPEDPETTTTTKRNPHWEPIPIFTKQCNCDIATVQYPCWATDALQVCEHLAYVREEV